MGISCVIRMPELSKLDIPEKQRFIFVKDETIFCDLKNEKRQIADRETEAVRGDYVLAELENADGGIQVLHVELGSRSFPDLENVLLGSTAGQELRGEVFGDETVIRVRSVRKVVDFPLTDEAIASLSIPGVETVTDYRRNYIQRHGVEIADRLFGVLQKKLMDSVIDMAELSLAEEELNHYHQQQRSMIQHVSGDVDQRLMYAYGQDGDKTPEECDRLFFEDNRQMFSFYIWAKELAKQNKICPSEEDARKSVENYCMVFEKTEEQIREEGLTDDALRSFYFQYGIGQLRKYYYSVVSFSATGISCQPCEAECLTKN